MTHKILYIVHCVDTEGPLYESVQATFERIFATFGLKFDASREQLARLKSGSDLPEPLRNAVMEFVSDERLNYNSDWAEIDKMVDEMMSDNWRRRHIDDFGQGYVFSWFILDHVGFETNPRRRALGYHVVYNHYLEKMKKYKPPKDKLYWHNHPVSFFFEANKTSNNFSFTNHHLQALSRRVIDFLDFPACFRPGCHTERPDINLFLEMWIPFDYGNQGMKERSEDKLQQDISDGRYGDWRMATEEWETYHPDFYNYQKKGAMKRYITRCLNLSSRIRPVTEEEIEKAFRRAETGRPTILSVTNHDEREMRPSIDWFMHTVRKVQKRYPLVKIYHSNAIDAVRREQRIPFEPPTQLSIAWKENRLDVKAAKPIWGPQPYFCFKTKTKQYIHENLDFQEGLHWSFVFDEDTIRSDQIEYIGIATNDNFGNTSVYRFPPGAIAGEIEAAFINEPCY